MLKIKISNVLFILLFLIHPVGAETINVSASEDAYIDQAHSNINYGNSTHMYTYYTSNGQEQKSFLKFNVPANTTKATLYVYTDGGWKNNQYASIFQSSSEWEENTITWNNPPFTEGISEIASVVMDSNNQWKTFNVSSVIIDSANPMNYSFRLRAAWGYNDNWVSKEGSYAPYLVVVTSDPVQTTPVADFSVSKTFGDVPLTVSFMDTSTGSPTSWTWDFGDGNTSTEQNPTHTFYGTNIYTVSLNVANSAGSNTTSEIITAYELKNISCSEDASVDKNNPDTNYGSLDYIDLDNQNLYTKYGYVKFNVPNYTSSMKLHIFNHWNAGDTSIKISASDWSENTITWNNKPSDILDSPSVSLSSDNTWYTVNVSTETLPPGDYTFRIFPQYGYNGRISSRESANAPYLEINTTTYTDIVSNNKTNDASKAFLVNTSDDINFNIAVPDPENVDNYSWYVNKIDQDNNLSNFNFTIPTFNISYPSTGIWEIRVQANYTNGSQVVREWLISGLTEKQAPHFIDFFTDQNNTFRWSSDPWGRALPVYYSPLTNQISNGYLSGAARNPDNTLLSKFDTTYGTIKLKIYNPGVQEEIGFYLYDENGHAAEMRWCSNDLHDYFSILGSTGYTPISRRWIGQAPGAHYWSSNKGWHDITIIHTKDDWWSIWDNGSMLPSSYLQAPNELTNVTTLKLFAGGTLRMDDIQVYKDRYIYPQTEIKYGSHPKWWIVDDYPAFKPVNDTGIIVFGRGVSLKQISTYINNDSLMTYNDSTKTATLNTNLFLKAGSELNISGETLLFNTPNNSLFIRPDVGTTLRIQNSTISTTGNNPMIWNFASTTAFTVFDPETSANITETRSNSRTLAFLDYRGRLIIENSTINNTCNLFMDGAHEIRINDTVFSNMSMLNYGANGGWGDGGYLDWKKSQSTGIKAIWIAPRDDLAAYSVNNISFVNPKGNIDLKVVGGEWIFNSTTIKNCNLSNINISTKKAYKYTDFNAYNHPWESSNISLLNCKYNESNFTVQTDMAKIKTKYYVDIVVKDTSGNSIPNAIITVESSNSSYYAENLTEDKRATNDGYGPGLGPGEGGSSSYSPEDPINGYQYYTYTGGSYFRWWDAQKLEYALTDTNGRTAPPSGNTSNSIVLTDKVFTNETGIQLNESIRFNLTINPPNSRPVYIQNVDPDSTWYREDPLLSKYTITVVSPQNSSKAPYITGFAPSVDNLFNLGEKKIFRVWTDENLKGMTWTVDEEQAAEGTLNYTWNVTEGKHKIEFSGISTNGNVSQVWNIGEKLSDNTSADNNQTHTTEFTPESTALTRNTGESVTFSMKSDQLLDSSWFINGKLSRSGTESITQSWSTPGIYNVTFSGSIGGKPILHTWTVNVIGSSEPQNNSIVRVDPEYQVASPGKPFALNIWVDPGTAITGAQFDLSFKDSMVKVGTVKEGNLFNQNGASTYFSNGTVSSSEGLIRHIYGSILGESTFSSPGTLAVINLTAGNGTGIAEFNLSNVIISDVNSSRVPNSVKNSTTLIDTAPELGLIGSKSVDETENLTFRVSAKDADRDSLTFSASGLPAGASFDPATGVFTWVPSKGQAGIYTVNFKVSDGYLSDLEDVKITVIPPNNAPSITSFQPANGSVFNEGDNITIALKVSDADGQTLSYLIKIDGIVYSNSPSYVWSTNYSSSGSHTIELAVSDGIEEVKKVIAIYINDVHPRWDVNKDGVVDIRDVTMVSRKFGTITKAPYPNWDVNQDGIVDITDLDIVKSHFGEKV